MANSSNLWVWLQCIGVASVCCCKEVYGYPHNNFNFPTPLVLAHFWQQHPYFFVYFLNVSSFFHMYTTLILFSLLTSIFASSNSCTVS